ncbi:LIM/homeobox protein Lhx9-like [Haliotis asinina]|uniref:LIM/homeobox protein Lhx9-like n=1 Tax=Haliotis asinina TaxID=109174 RepID=UPI0035320B70
MVEKTILQTHEGSGEFQSRTVSPDSLALDCHVTTRHQMPLNNTGDDLPGVCAGCGGRIVERYYLLAVDKQWHVSCLKCSDCKFRLDSELTCFARDGLIYCKEDYYRRFGIKRCSRCHLGIAANELVMRARDLVYHLSCFTCSSCNRALTPGEQFGMKDHLVYCRTDYEIIFQGEYLQSLSPELGGPNIPYYNGVGAVQKGRPRKRKSPCPELEGCPSMGLGPGENPDRPGEVLDREGYQHQTPRQKRVRTSFKHHQLRTMKSYFALNHNPDAKDLKQLAQKTGLSKRVLQVWFQNARAKYRRNLLKQQDSDKGNSNTNGSSNGDKSKDSHDQSLTDLSNTRSPALSDISSNASLSDIQTPALDTDQGSNSISDLFSSTIASIN